MAEFCLMLNGLLNITKSEFIDAVRKSIYRSRLPHHMQLYWTHCNGRQRAIIHRIIGFEKNGYKHFCNASTHWWVKEYLPSCGINISESTFRRDLLHLEKLGLIRRNVWNKPKEAGGKVRIIYTAWGLESYARYFLFRTTRYNNNEKPDKVVASFFNFEREIQELSYEFCKKYSTFNSFKINTLKK